MRYQQPTFYDNIIFIVCDEATFQVIVTYRECRHPSSRKAKEASFHAKKKTNFFIHAKSPNQATIHASNTQCLLVFLILATRSIERISYGNVVRWVGGWLSVCHSRYCIKRTKPILKLFRSSASPIIEAFGTHFADTKFQGEPVHRGRLIHGEGELAIFNGYCRLSRNRCEVGRWLLWNVNRKSWVPDWMG